MGWDIVHVGVPPNTGVQLTGLIDAAIAVSRGADVPEMVR